MKEQWENRYSNEEFMYGKEPNEFYKQEIDKLKPGTAFFIGEGEGRNSVYAAKLGWEVSACDWSENARLKALKWAEENKVTVNYNIADFNNLQLTPDAYDLIVFIFIHVEPDLREKLHTLAVNSLKPGGIIILEAYEKDQLKYNSGGPKNEELLYSLEDIYTDFNSLELLSFSKEIINLNEGPLHKGEGAVIRYVGYKPQKQ